MILNHTQNYAFKIPSPNKRLLREKKKVGRTTYKFWIKTDREYQYQNKEYSQKDLKWDIKSLFQNASLKKMPIVLNVKLFYKQYIQKCNTPSNCSHFYILPVLID